MTENFLKKGYAAEQAKLKVVWENPHISSICSAMPNMTILQANIDAALNQQRLSEGDRQRLEQYARETAPGYCAGCAHLCESAVGLDVPISDILRCSMYAHGYGSRDMALSLFNTLPTGARNNVFKADSKTSRDRENRTVTVRLFSPVWDFSKTVRLSHIILKLH
jgi:uncharacterized protein